MILFCDTSALVKLYVREADSDRLMAAVLASEVVAICRIAWVEAISAMARRAREMPQDGPALSLARQSFEADWPDYLTLELTQDLVALAGDYADSFALRAYDAVQLAAAQSLHRELPEDTVFACYDARLVKAARVLGMSVF